MKRFILLLNHDDISLSAYLQYCLECGEHFIKASGNIFTFKKAGPSAERIGVVTYVNDDPDLKMKLQLEDYVYLMKKRGWQVISTGAPEDIFDSKRHVFLKTDQADLPLPNISQVLVKKANDHEVHSCIRCFAMLFLLLGFDIFLLNHDLDIFLSSSHILVPGVIAVVFWILSLVWNIRGGIAIKRKTQCDNGFRYYLAVDKAVLFCLLSVFCLFAALLADLWLFPDNSKITVFGEQRINIYQDDLPLTLEDLSIPAAGLFRSSRMTERNGFVMKSFYCMDQSFSDANTVKDLSFISYAVYQSNWQIGLYSVARQKGLNHYLIDDRLAEIWNCSGVYSDGIHRMIILYPRVVLTLSTSADIYAIDPDIVLDRLDPNRNIFRK